jgi:hypothetical protein
MMWLTLFICAAAISLGLCVAAVALQEEDDRHHRGLEARGESL